MAKFTLLVTSSPFDQQGSNTALQFARAILDAGHQLCGVFFYQGGVLNANVLQCPPEDECHYYNAWQELAEKAVPMHVCVTAAARRGVISESDARDQDMSNSNLTEPFQASGLGQLVELMAQADRVVQF
ncbi:sulfurtransferase complex subunit TusD [Lacimicrobium sp. SS2-24]|uniref:sulfurtransferase complex subunit TusD n=1 Tax=Lacimicrobium sp. SS2-24 TaxID=2005569 RepID=UPI000B4B510D|nr:sulfurtransferase complex subunit TusD [Lacimicrobium sp. SS2-24]